MKKPESRARGKNQYCYSYNSPNICCTLLCFSVVAEMIRKLSNRFLSSDLFNVNSGLPSFRSRLRCLFPGSFSETPGCPSCIKDPNGLCLIGQFRCLVEQCSAKDSAFRILHPFESCDYMS